MENTSKETEYKVGSAIKFVDEFGKPHDALVSIWWGKRVEGIHNGEPFVTEPCCNLLYVVSDEKKEDCYGRQMDRSTSVVHKSSQQAHGNYWCHASEL